MIISKKFKIGKVIYKFGELGSRGYKSQAGEPSGRGKVNLVRKFNSKIVKIRCSYIKLKYIYKYKE